MIMSVAYRLCSVQLFLLDVRLKFGLLDHCSAVIAGEPPVTFADEAGFG